METVYFFIAISVLMVLFFIGRQKFTLADTNVETGSGFESWLSKNLDY